MDLDPALNLDMYPEPDSDLHMDSHPVIQLNRDPDKKVTLDLEGTRSSY